MQTFFMAKPPRVKSINITDFADFSYPNFSLAQDNSDKVVLKGKSVEIAKVRKVAYNLDEAYIANYIYW